MFTFWNEKKKKYMQKSCYWMVNLANIQWNAQLLLVCGLWTAYIKLDFKSNGTHKTFLFRISTKLIEWSNVQCRRSPKKTSLRSNCIGFMNFEFIQIKRRSPFLHTKTAQFYSMNYGCDIIINHVSQVQNAKKRLAELHKNVEHPNIIFNMHRRRWWLRVNLEL